MLSPQTLQRTTLSYARGYRDGYSKKPVEAPTHQRLERPFAADDYSNGYDAGRNDRKWDDHYAARHNA